MLRDGLGEGTYRSIRGELKKAQEQHAYAMTPYGRVLQALEFPFQALPTWEVDAAKGIDAIHERDQCRLCGSHG